MDFRYPPIEPDVTGLLAVGDGQEIYWEASGNPHGKPVVVLHGGPGSGLSKNRRRVFDPAAYRVIQFDQRGCGLSTPHAGDHATDVRANTTHHLIADIERLREHLGVERWLVWGGSWGVTLGLAYAQRHPDRVTEMILVSMTLTRRRDVRWFAYDAGRFFPQEWERFQAGVPEADREDIVVGYDRLLNGQADPAIREQAAADWTAWEDTLVSLEEGSIVPNPCWSDRRFRMCFARLVTHYFSHAAWLEEDELLRNAGLLAGIPAVLLHGRLDLSGPPDIAWQLARAWRGAELHFIRGGHTGDEEMTRLMFDAADRFATR
jgi:proline iminopeptidase